MYIFAELIRMAASIFEMLIIVRVLLSWFNPNSFNPLIVQLYRITDPILKPFQDLIPAHKIGLDISPIFAIMAIRLVAQALIKFFFSF